MSIILSGIDIVVVDFESTLTTLLDTIDSITPTPLLYVEFEGNGLGRHGPLLVVSLYILDLNKIYLIDIHTLGGTAFTTTNSITTSLKGILESSIIQKVTYDIRDGSQALFRDYQISVDGSKELVLLELAARVARAGSTEYLAWLKECIDDSSASTAEKADWWSTKEEISRLCNLKTVTPYELAKERPMMPEIEQYCAGNVAVFPKLDDFYNAKLRSSRQMFWHTEVEKATRDRITLSQRPTYNGFDANADLGPWTGDDIDDIFEAWED